MCGRFRGTIDGFVSGSEEMAQRGARASHTITPVEVVFNGAKALSVSTGSITVRFDLDGAEFDCVSWTRFISRLQRTDDGWKMLTLDTIYERDSIMPIVPHADTPTHFDLKSSRKSYQCLVWLLTQKGYTINEQLAGLDQPESVDQLMRDQYQWLNES